jgi:primosomal replication protein N
MKRAHINTATFAGRVCEMSLLHEDPLGHPLLQFSLDTRHNVELAEALDVSQKHRCVVGDALAEELSRTVSNGSRILVHGPLFVNSRAKRSLVQRIANLVVEHATVLRPPRQPGAEALPEADELIVAQNDVHLVGKLVAVGSDVSGATRLTIATRLPFPALHDVLVWFDFDGAVGATVEVRDGMLAQHVTTWSDGQVRQLSTIECFDVLILDGPRPAPFNSLPLVLRGS